MKAIIRKLIIALIAGAMLAVSAGVLVVSAAYALYALLRDQVGAPGAAALTALAAAVLIAIVAVSFAAFAKGDKKKKPVPAQEQDLVGKLIAMAQERPIVSVGALVGGIALALRNPALVAVAMKMFLDPKPKAGGKR